MIQIGCLNLSWIRFMIEEIKKIRATNKDLRDFAVIFGIIFFLFSGFLFYKEKDSYQVCLYVSGSLVSLGFLLPIVLKPFYTVWMVFSVLFGWVMTRVILSLLYYLIMTPIGLIMRALGNDLLDLKKINHSSYWNLRNSDDKNNHNYEKQF